MRRDGTIAWRPGFDEATGMFIMDPVALHMPRHPTQKDAERALALLEGLLQEFPFVDPEAETEREKTASASVGLSTLLTPVARSAIEYAPLHATRAPVAGTGKSYLFDIASAVAIGTTCPVIAASDDEKENMKCLASEMLAGSPIVNFDNVNGTLSGGLLCQAVSQEIVAPRILGQSETPHITNCFTIFASGNNLSVRGDLSRRTLFCAMDAKKDAKLVQEREFNSDPVAMVLADRGRYIAACLTILRAHALEGYPGMADLKALVGFGDWTRVVRGALVWLDKVDPVDSLNAGRAEDPQRAERLQFVEALADLLGTGEGTAATVAEIIEAIRFDYSFDSSKMTEKEIAEATARAEAIKTLRAILQRFADRYGVVNTIKAGTWLGRFRYEPFDRKRLESCDAGKGKSKWYVNELPKS